MPLFILLLFSLLTSSLAAGQRNTHSKPLLLGAHFSGSGNGKTAAYGGIGIDFIKPISTRFDWQFNINGSYTNKLSQPQQFDDKKYLLLTTSAAIRAGLFNKLTIVQPYAFAGMGLSKFQNYYGIFLPAGIGAQVSIFKNASLLLHSQYRIGLTNTINSYFFYSVGLAGTVRRRRFISANKKIIQQQAVAITGERDRDNDGIPDSSDACPETIGVARYKGCPVPDKDKDGINDEEDKCIDIPGVREYEGCPPPKREVRQEVKTKISLLAKAVYFETGSASLLPASDSALRQLVTILKADSSLKLSIEGHTDNVGDPLANEELSRRRANAVLAFLKANGISRDRLTADGFGQTQPIADNTTPEGRAINRRVVFKLSY